MLLLARMRRGWTQRQLAEAAGVPVSTVSRIETGARQPSLVTLSRLLAAADLELRHQLEDYDDHDEVLDARGAALTDEQRAAATDTSSQLIWHPLPVAHVAAETTSTAATIGLAAGPENASRNGRCPTPQRGASRVAEKRT